MLSAGVLPLGDSGAGPCPGCVRAGQELQGIALCQLLGEDRGK